MSIARGWGQDPLITEEYILIENILKNKLDEVFKLIQENKNGPLLRGPRK